MWPTCSLRVALSMKALSRANLLSAVSERPVGLWAGSFSHVITLCWVAASLSSELENAARSRFGVVESSLDGSSG